MKKLMFIIHVPWDWIKQRPHFLAEELNFYYDMYIFEEKSYKKKNLCENNRENLKIFQIFRLPFQRFKFIDYLNHWIFKILMKKKIQDFEYIWFNDVFTYGLIESYIPRMKKVIYDCMDDVLEFDVVKNDSFRKKLAMKNEKLLVKNANIVFVSSEYLKKKLISRYEIKNEKIFVINNGINSKFLENKPFLKENKSEVKVLTYIGTISTWFDFDLLLNSLEKLEGIEYHLYGPLEVKLPENTRIKYKGILEHSQIIRVMEETDILIMPFKLNELILAVNPVKLYEYIYSMKPVISISYAETEKFNNFVHLYKNLDEYILIVNEIMKGNMKENSFDSTYKFLEENTWASRGKAVIEIIENHNL